MRPIAQGCNNTAPFIEKEHRKMTKNKENRWIVVATRKEGEGEVRKYSMPDEKNPSRMKDFYLKLGVGVQVSDYIKSHLEMSGEEMTFTKIGD